MTWTPQCAAQAATDPQAWQSDRARHRNRAWQNDRVGLRRLRIPRHGKVMGRGTEGRYCCARPTTRLGSGSYVITGVAE